MTTFVRDRDFYKTLVVLAIPITLQNLIGLGVNLMDTVMLGSLGDDNISASALANQPYFVFTLFMFGLCSGACVLTAQYWGKGDTDAIRRILTLAVRASVICSLFFSAAVLLFPDSVMSLYTEDADVIRLGSQFLRIIGFSYIVSAISTTYLYVLRSVENVRLPLLINLTSFVLNTILNWILIYGKFGLPAMGIRGSATGTLCARIVELILAMIYAHAFDRRLRFRLPCIFYGRTGFLRDFLRYSLPVVVNETLWGTGVTMQSVVIGHIGSMEVAANSIAGVVQRLGSVAVFGVANAAAVIIGKQIGAGDERKASHYARMLLMVSLILGFCSAGFVFAIRGPAVAFYGVSAATKEYARQIIGVYAVIMMFMAFNSVNIVGVLRGGGDTRFAMAIDVGCMWLVALPLGAAAGLIWHLPLPVVFFLLSTDEPVKFLIGLARFRTGRWLRNVTR